MNNSKALTGWIAAALLVLLVACGQAETTAPPVTDGHEAETTGSPSAPDIDVVGHPQGDSSIDTASGPDVGTTGSDEGDTIVSADTADESVDAASDMTIAEILADGNADAPDADAGDLLPDMVPVCTTDDDCPAEGTGQCLQAACVNGSCQLENVPDGTVCDDGNLCTMGDACLEGVCQPAKPLVCDDFNVCTMDSCDSTSGCAYVPNTAACDDGNACTTGDTCKTGACAGTAVNCDDSNPCTDDTCDAVLGCKTTANIAPCDDDNPCTIGDACDNGQCAAGTPKNCAVVGACAVGACSPVDGKCKYSDAVDSTPCNDGNACSESDACKNGLCVGKPAVCDDQNLCTQETCDPETGCTYLAAGGSCDLDDNACTADLCVAGACAAGASKPCDDLNPCTADKCDIETGECVYDKATFEGVGCDADDSVCMTGDVCKNGQCAAGKALNCDDGNPCTDDACDSKVGCTHKPNTASCDADGSACTVGDVCQSGVCVAGAKKTCDDFNSCTDDACAPATGFCTNTTNAAGCDDGDPCTKDDACSGGYCAGTPFACDPCMNYGGTVFVITTDHVNLCNAKILGSDVGKLAIPEPWEVCSIADMLKYAPAKGLCDIGWTWDSAWVSDACEIAVCNVPKYIESCSSTILNNASSYKCPEYCLSYQYSYRFMVCRD